MSEPAAPPRSLRQLAQIPVTRLRGVGERKAAALAQIGIETVFDLLTTYPYRYIDRTRQVDLADMAVGDQAVVLGTVRAVRTRSMRQGRSLVEVTVHDGTAGMKAVFFNQPWRVRQLHVGAEALFFGKLDSFRGTPQMANPVDDDRAAHHKGDAGGAPARRSTLRIVPVYPASAKADLSSWELGAWIEEAIRRAGELGDPLPPEWRSELGLVDRTQAFHDIHLPETAAAHPVARRRLAFDELFRLQLALLLVTHALARDARAIRHAVSPLDVTSRARSQRAPTLVQRFLSTLPFELTRAQRRALAAIFAELAGPTPMHRLLQGDVGSGKTVVAVAALLAAVQGGHQGALMAPTEVLAEQHLLAVRSLVDGLCVPDPACIDGERPLSVALLTNRTTAVARARLHERLRAGELDLVVGTHALLGGDVRFHSLGVVVIDEQHRFGVEQRAALRDKGRSSVGASGEPGADPDLLVMSATPIPRTAAMVLFGDLDMVVLDELPPGRAGVTTLWASTGDEVEGAWRRVRHEVAAGRRAYVVCPLVEGSARIQARSAVDERERLATGELSGVRLGLLHGQMGSRAKEQVMADFRSGAVQVLVTTTVIEVGVDVPEATVMVVEDADRFGIAQLHQLRGRVGRSDRPSWCYLLASAASEEAARRLEALVRSTDGFELAEIDLELRGEGTIMGPHQKGRTDLKLATLRQDADLLAAARKVAEALVEADPHLGSHGDLLDEIRLFLGPEEEQFLLKS